MHCYFWHFIHDFHCWINCVTFIKKIITVIFGTYGIPKTSGCETMVWVHFINRMLFITLNFFQVVNNLYVALEDGLLFHIYDSFFWFGIFLPFFFFFVLFFVDIFGTAFWPSFLSFGLSKLIIVNFILSWSWWFNLTGLFGR